MHDLSALYTVAIFSFFGNPKSYSQIALLYKLTHTSDAISDERRPTRAAKTRTIAQHGLAHSIHITRHRHTGIGKVTVGTIADKWCNAAADGNLFSSCPLPS